MTQISARAVASAEGGPTYILAQVRCHAARTDAAGRCSIDPEQVCFIIKAKEVDAKVEPDDPDSGSNPADDREIDILEDFADDPTLQELTGAIQALNSDQQAELLAMLWIGRGDYAVADWEQALEQAGDTVSGSFASYLVGTPILGDLVEEGYSQLGYSCEEYEIDRL
jgi:hypothetical protein